MALTMLEKLKESRRRHPFAQFGTPDDECTNNGSQGCTHAVWRFIIWAYKGKWLSHDEISKICGYPCSADRGMRVSESQELCRDLNLPLIYKGNLPSGDLLKASRTGPCMFAVRYGDWPNWAHYNGQTRPRPWARPLDKAGRNQFTGFTGAHAAALLGYNRVTLTNGKFVRNDCFVFEPNHDSGARPEKVPFDIVTQTQLNAAYRAVVTKLGWSATMAFIPTKSPTFPGGL